MNLRDVLRDYTVSDVLDSWKIPSIRKKPSMMNERIINDRPLEVGTVIRYGLALYRVEHVSACRARIVPLSKKHVTLADGREFDAERGGINISPNSCVEIVTDLERAKLELELEATEQELAAAKREVNSRDTEEQELVKLEAQIAADRKTLWNAKTPRVAATGAGWRLAEGEVPTYKEGSLAARVYAYIAAHPGQTTAEIVAGVGGPGALAACVSRFNQAGVIERAS